MLSGNKIMQKKSNPIKLIRDYKKNLLFQCLSATGVSITAVAVSLVASNLVDYYLYKELFKLRQAYILVVVGAASLCLFYISIHFANKSIYRSIAALRKDIGEKYLYHDVSVKQEKDEGTFISLFTDDMKNIENFFVYDLRSFFENAILFIACSVVLIRLNAVIYLLVLLISIVFSLSIFIYKKKRVLEEKKITISDRINKLVPQTFTLLPMLRLLPNSLRVKEENHSVINERRIADIQLDKISNIFNLISLICNLSRELLVILVGLIAEALPVGSIVAMINLSSFISESSLSVYNLFLEYQKADVSFRRISHLLSLPQEKISQEKNDDIVNFGINHVSFRYDESSNELKDINLYAQKGDIIFIHGDVGCGKSTLVKIASGLLKADDGRVFLNNIISDIAALRNHVSYLDQDALIFEGSLSENISAFSNKPDLPFIQNILKRVNLFDWVQSLPDGIDTIIRESEISGGQRQRVALARALYKRSPLIILDEPFASLDHDNQESLKQVLTSLASDHIIIIVSHMEDMLHPSSLVRWSTYTLNNGILCRDEI